MPFDGPLLLPVAAIPLWSQYVDFLKWVLDGIADKVGNAGDEARKQLGNLGDDAADTADDAADEADRRT